MVDRWLAMVGGKGGGASPFGGTEGGFSWGRLGGDFVGTGLCPSANRGKNIGNNIAVDLICSVRAIA